MHDFPCMYSISSRQKKCNNMDNDEIHKLAFHILSLVFFFTYGDVIQILFHNATTTPGTPFTNMD